MIFLAISCWFLPIFTTFFIWRKISLNFSHFPSMDPTWTDRIRLMDSIKFVHDNVSNCLVKYQILILRRIKSSKLQLTWDRASFCLRTCNGGDMMSLGDSDVVSISGSRGSWKTVSVSKVSMWVKLLERPWNRILKMNFINLRF